jgi:predicted dehydrogenase
MTSAIGAAVIGAGMAGRAHAAAYRSASTIDGAPLPPIRLVSIVDAEVALAEQTARRYGFERAEGDWHALLEDPAIDVVSIAVANALHREMAEALLGAGKHVLCEKPLAPSAADAEAMVGVAAAVPQVAAVGFTYRRSPAVAAIARLVEEGALGRVSHFAGRYWGDYAAAPDGPMGWRYRGPAGSGALADLGTHLIDLAEMLCGPIASVSGAILSTFISHRAFPIGTVVGHAATAVSDVREPVENEDIVTFTARFASGTTGTFSISRVAFGLPNSLGFELFGERGAATFDMERPGEFGFVDGGPRAATAGVRQVFVGPEHPYVADALPMPYRSVGYSQNDLFVFQARAFLEQVAGIEGGLPPCPPFDEGLRNLRLLDAIVASARSKGAEVAIRQGA